MTGKINATQEGIEQLFQKKNTCPIYELTEVEHMQTTDPFGKEFGNIVFEIATLDCLVPYVITPENEISPLIIHFSSAMPRLDEPRLQLMLETDLTQTFPYRNKKENCMIYKIEQSPFKIVLSEGIPRGDGYMQNAFQLTARVWYSYLEQAEAPGT